VKLLFTWFSPVLPFPGTALSLEVYDEDLLLSQHIFSFQLQRVSEFGCAAIIR